MDNSDPVIKAQFDAAVAFHNSGQGAQAQVAYESVIAACPGHAEAMHNLGLLFVHHGHLADAAEWMQRATIANPAQPIYLSNYGNVLQDLQRWSEAVPQYEKAIALNPGFADANYNLGNALQKIGQHSAAIESYQHAIALNPAWAEAYLNCGNSHDALGQPEQALRNYDKVIECNPTYSGGYVNRSNVLAKLGRHAEALAGYDQAARLGGDAYISYIKIAEILLEKNQCSEAVEKCNLAIKIKPNDSAAYLLLGRIYFFIRNLEGAVQCFRRASELSPDSADAYNGLGLAHVKAGHFKDSQAYFRKALEINPKMHIARINLGDAHFVEGDLQAALEAFQGLEFSIQPLGLMQFFKQQLGDWSSYDADKENFVKCIREPRIMGITEDPWHVLRITDSLSLAKDVAQNFFHNATKTMIKVPPLEKRGPGKKIKIGYFSPDFRDHAVSHLTLQLLESHSRDKFETYAFAFGYSAPSDTLRPKLVKAFDHFIDINNKNDLAVINLVRELEIDIAVDLAGITSESRVAIFAGRAAPIQVNYLGFTGTLGSSCHDYIIADPVVIPDDSLHYYTESVARIPCVMPYDARHDIEAKMPTRELAGLPSQGFVFCSFNQCFKITPETFDSWMRILLKVPHSCLWINQARPQAMANYKKEAEARGVSPDRIIFAPRVLEIDGHLARLKCADLFLDTFPYNAHTSAIDALWAGVPLITRMGDSFASRMAGSLLKSVGLGDLIVQNKEEYEAMAVDLANNPTKLSAIRQRLAQNRLSHPLFNPELYLKNYERALSVMHERHCEGLPPEHFKVTE
ncbi:MAG: tetratricopeptide repeat protein [bacterium]